MGYQQGRKLGPVCWSPTSNSMFRFSLAYVSAVATNTGKPRSGGLSCPIYGIATSQERSNEPGLYSLLVGAIEHAMWTESRPARGHHYLDGLWISFSFCRGLNIFTPRDQHCSLAADGLPDPGEKFSLCGQTNFSGSAAWGACYYEGEFSHSMNERACGPRPSRFLWNQAV